MLILKLVVHSGKKDFSVKLARELMKRLAEVGFGELVQTKRSVSLRKRKIEEMPDETRKKLRDDQEDQ